MSLPALTHDIATAPARPLIGLFSGSLSLDRFTVSGVSLFDLALDPPGRFLFSLPDEWYGRWSIEPLRVEPRRAAPALPAISAEDILVLPRRPVALPKAETVLLPPPQAAVEVAPVVVAPSPVGVPSLRPAGLLVRRGDLGWLVDLGLRMGEAARPVAPEAVPPRAGPRQGWARIRGGWAGAWPSIGPALARGLAALRPAALRPAAAK